MRFAATCILSTSGGIVPEADPIQLKSILEKLDVERERSGTISLKPPLPARYRYELYNKLIRVISADELEFLSYVPQSGVYCCFYYDYYFLILSLSLTLNTNIYVNDCRSDETFYSRFSI